MFKLLVWFAWISFVLSEINLSLYQSSKPVCRQGRLAEQRDGRSLDDLGVIKDEGAVRLKLQATSRGTLTERSHEDNLV